MIDIYHEIPSRKKTGCLPRKSRPGEWCPMASERIEPLPMGEIERLAETNTCTPFVKTILDQDGVGSCAAEAATQVVMVARAIAGLPHILLNPWFVYHHTSGGVDRGSSIDENLRFIQEHGIAPMDVWGRDQGWRRKPSKEAYDAAKEFAELEWMDIASVAELATAPIRAFPSIYGSRGHAVTSTEYLAKGPTGPNSWGNDWGNDGIGTWVSWRQVNWGYGAWCITGVNGVAL